MEEIASQYGSIAEFKAKNFQKYLIAKRKGLLKKLFPEESVVKEEPIKGIFFLYRGHKVLYIGSSTIDALQAIKALKATTTIPFETYRLHKLHSNADIHVLTEYLIHKFKPHWNEDVKIGQLSFSIDTPKVLGPAIKGKV